MTWHSLVGLSWRCQQVIELLRRNFAELLSLDAFGVYRLPEFKQFLVYIYDCIVFLFLRGLHRGDLNIVIFIGDVSGYKMNNFYYVILEKKIVLQYFLYIDIYEPKFNKLSSLLNIFIISYIYVSKS